MSKICYAVEVQTDSLFSSNDFGITSGYFRFITDRPLYTGTDAGVATIPIGDNCAFKLTLSGSETIAIAFQSGQLYAAENTGFKTVNTVPIVGTRFTVLSNADFTGDELETAKGSAPALGDMFEVVSNETDVEAIKYVGVNRWFEDFLFKDDMTNPSRNIEDIELTGGYGTLSGFTFSIKNDVVAGVSTPFWKMLSDNSVYLTNRVVKLYVVIDDVFYQIWTGIIDDNPYDETSFTFVCKSNFKAIHKDLPPRNFEEILDEDAENSPIPICIGDIEYALVTGVKNKELEFVTLVKHGVPNIKSNCAQAVGYYSPSAFTLNTTSCFFKYGELNGAYLFVANGGSTAGDAYGITTPDTEIGIKIKQSFATSAVTHNTEFTIEDNIPGFVLATHGKEGSANIQDRWNFRISKTGITKGFFSNNDVYGIFQNANLTYKVFLAESERYVDLSRMVSEVSLSDPSITLKAPSLTLSGEVFYYEPIYYSFQFTTVDVSGSGASIVDAIPGNTASRIIQANKIFNKDRGSAFKARNTFGVFLYSDMSYLYSELAEDIDKIYLAIDYEADWKLTTSKQIKIQLQGYDQYKRYLGNVWEYINNSPVEQANYIPNQYYGTSAKANGESSIFKQFESSFQLPDDVVSNIKNKNYPYLRLRIQITGQSDKVFDIDVKEVGFFYEKQVSFLNNDIYAAVKGELLADGTTQSNTVYNALRLVCEDYDSIATKDIDYGNLTTKRNAWYVGHQLTERKNSKDYIKEICEQSFVAAFQNRKGQLAFNAWLENDSTAKIHDHTGINRDTITNWELTGVDKIFNTFSLNYSYNPADDSYFSAYQIKDVNVPASRPTGDMAILWDVCAAAYSNYKAIKEFKKDLSFFNDRSRLQNNLPGLGVDGSAFRFLQNAVFWLTRQKRNVTYSLPLNADNAVLELCDPVAFRDTIYTNAAVDTAYISGNIKTIEFDIKTDSVVVSSILKPNDTIDEDFGDIIETGSAANTITESGSQTDTITENGI